MRIALIACFCAMVVAFFPVAASACPCSEIPKPPETSPEPVDRKKGIEFSHTAKYREEFRAAIESARAACKKHIGEPNVCVVSDLDETLIDNRAHFAENLDFVWENFVKYVDESKAPLLKPTAEFLAWARKNGFAVFFITGRPEDTRRGTINNLVKRGVTYDGLYMRALDDKSAAEDMKIAYRKAIEAMGYKIIVNIGDQISDLYGGHAEECSKLPNRMYYIP